MASAKAPMTLIDSKFMGDQTPRERNLVKLSAIIIKANARASA